jgi:hypothetical protein
LGRPKDEAFWTALEDNLERCKAECAAIDREMKTLLAEGRADTDEGRAAQSRRLTELQTRRGESVRKMLAGSTQGGPGPRAEPPGLTGVRLGRGAGGQGADRNGPGNGHDKGAHGCLKAQYGGADRLPGLAGDNVDIMRASNQPIHQVWITRYGPPEVLELREAAMPQPSEGQVLIKVAAAGINFADIMTRLGLYPDAPKPPCVVGYEVAGEVAAVGPSSAGFAVGDRVIALTRFGGYSSYINVPQEQVFALPPGLDFAQGAALPVTYLTAYQLIIAMGRLRASETVLVHSAAGGVGLSAIDLAKIISAKMIGVASAASTIFFANAAF